MKITRAEHTAKINLSFLNRFIGINQGSTKITLPWLSLFKINQPQ
jgi:hypothetical protein